MMSPKYAVLSVAAGRGVTRAQGGGSMVEEMFEDSKEYALSPLAYVPDHIFPSTARLLDTEFVASVSGRLQGQEESSIADTRYAFGPSSLHMTAHDSLLKWSSEPAQFQPGTCLDCRSLTDASQMLSPTSPPPPPHCLSRATSTDCFSRATSADLGGLKRVGSDHFLKKPATVDEPCPAQEQCSRCTAKDAKIAEMVAEIHIIRRRVHALEAQPLCQHDGAVAAGVTWLHPTPLQRDEKMVVDEDHQAEVTRLRKEVRKGSARRCNSCCLCADHVYSKQRSQTLSPRARAHTHIHRWRD